MKFEKLLQNVVQEQRDGHIQSNLDKKIKLIQKMNTMLPSKCTSFQAEKNPMLLTPNQNQRNSSPVHQVVLSN